MATDRDDREDALRLSHFLVALHIGSLLLLLIVVISTTLWISSQHNKLAQEGSIRLVQGAVDSFRARAFTLIRDYSIWDEGLDAVLTDDRDWLYSNIGVGVTEIGSFDLMMLDVPGAGPAFGWIEGSPPEGEAGLLPEAFLAQLLALFEAPVPTVATRTAVMKLDGNPWVFAVSRMVPISGQADLPQDQLPVQIHGYRFSDERLAQIAQGTLTQDLVFTDEPGPTQARLPLTGHKGETVTYLAWTPPSPGGEILRQVATPLALALAVASAISAFSARYAVRSARKLEKALDAAQAADRSKTEFLSNVSHELRTPMNGILGAAQLLAMTELGEEQRELLGVLQTSGNAQMALISDLLDWTKLEGGNRRIVAEPFEPAEVLRDVSEMIRVAAARKNIRFDCDLRAVEDVLVVGDSRALRQIITNLLGNAVKFTDRGSVALRTRLVHQGERSRLVIEVSDTGTGIPSDSLERIFDRFYRVDGSLTRTTEGSGLGLSISRKLAQLTGATIIVNSKMGVGSTFTYSADVRLREAEEATHAA